MTTVVQNHELRLVFGTFSKKCSITRFCCAFVDDDC
jgi:hypothetical protein